MFMIKSLLAENFQEENNEKKQTLLTVNQKKEINVITPETSPGSSNGKNCRKRKMSKASPIKHNLSTPPLSPQSDSPPSESSTHLPENKIKKSHDLLGSSCSSIKINDTSNQDFELLKNIYVNAVLNLLMKNENKSINNPINQNIFNSFETTHTNSKSDVKNNLQLSQFTEQTQPQRTNKSEGVSTKNQKTIKLPVNEKQTKTLTSTSAISDFISVVSIRKPSNGEDEGANGKSSQWIPKSVNSTKMKLSVNESGMATYFSCKLCGKTYTTLGALKMHIRTHTLPCKCNICGKAFSRPWLLQGHIRTHTGEKPFHCEICSRSFADRSNLRAHIQTHSNTKRYSCKKCQKTFSRMSLLNRHLAESKLSVCCSNN
ncbi:hypothetical protein SNEBB_004528 [Seison nebaliae]|nr:hypothetical protein SNEBB_004528 [Seison nebaliae]